MNSEGADCSLRMDGTMTTGNTIPKGFILKARTIEDSAIAHASPCTREIWDLILRKANFRDGKCGRTTIKRGQWLTSYEEIRELLHWHVGYRKLTYTWHQINASMKYMRSHLMVTTAKATRGFFITAVNYDVYQRLDNYERRNERQDEDHDNAAGQRRNGRKGRKKKEGTFVPPTALQVDRYAMSIGYHKPNLGRDFVQKYEALDWCITGGKRMSNWKLTVQTWRRWDERNPCRQMAGSPAAETIAPLVRGSDGRTPRQRRLDQMEGK